MLRFFAEEKRWRFQWIEIIIIKNKKAANIGSFFAGINIKQIVRFCLMS